MTWGKEASMGGKIVGRPLAEYPAWFRTGTPRPSAGRECFVTWNYFKQDDPLLGWPADGKVTLKSLASGSTLFPENIASVALLGTTEKLGMTRDADGFHVSLPSQKPGPYADSAIVLKITR